MGAWRRVVRLPAVVGVAVVGAGCLPLSGSGYRLVRLPTAGGEAARSFVVATNDRGQVLGQAEEGWVLWTGGELTTHVQSFGTRCSSRMAPVTSRPWRRGQV